MTEPTFGTHPHAGLSAVTVLFEDSEGTFRNRDSLGNDIDLAPGDLYWFKAARGALHNEQPRPGAKTHALQVFVGLPADQRQDAPSAFHLRAEDIPLIQGERSKARLVLGTSNGISGAQAPDLQLTLLDINLDANGQFQHRGGSDQHSWILAVKGDALVSWDGASTALKSGTAIAVAGSPNIALSADHAAHVVLFQGQPLRAPFVQRGPFAMGGEAELDAVEAAYRAGRLGSLD
jgi:redox-sensitive bicupin YhaK (pirin superfamily)